MKRPDAADLTRFGVGSTLLHTFSTPHSIWVRHEDGWRNPTGEPTRVYDDKWADGCIPLYAKLVLRIEPPEPEPAVELPTEPTLGWAEQDYKRLAGVRKLGVFASGENSNPSEHPALDEFSSSGKKVNQLYRVNAFTPATAVPTEALDRLRNYSLIGEYTLLESVQQFFTAVDGAPAKGGVFAEGIRAHAWDEGYEAGRDDENFFERGIQSDPDAAEHPHANPHRAEKATA